jgi:hypothetical protein
MHLPVLLLALLLDPLSAMPVAISPPTSTTTTPVSSCSLSLSPYLRPLEDCHNSDLEEWRECWSCDREPDEEDLARIAQFQSDLTMDRFMKKSLVEQWLEESIRLHCSSDKQEFAFPRLSPAATDIWADGLASSRDQTTIEPAPLSSQYPRQHHIWPTTVEPAPLSSQNHHYTPPPTRPRRSSHHSLRNTNSFALSLSSTPTSCYLCHPTETSHILHQFGFPPLPFERSHHHLHSTAAQAHMVEPIDMKILARTYLDARRNVQCAGSGLLGACAWLLSRLLRPHWWHGPQVLLHVWDLALGGVVPVFSWSVYRCWRIGRSCRVAMLGKAPCRSCLGLEMSPEMMRRRRVLVSRLDQLEWPGCGRTRFLQLLADYYQENNE